MDRPSQQRQENSSERCWHKHPSLPIRSPRTVISRGAPFGRFKTELAVPSAFRGQAGGGRGPQTRGNAPHLKDHLRAFRADTTQQGIRVGRIWAKCPAALPPGETSLGILITPDSSRPLPAPSTTDPPVTQPCSGGSHLPVIPVPSPLTGRFPFILQDPGHASSPSPRLCSHSPRMALMGWRYWYLFFFPSRFLVLSGNGHDLI